MKMFRHGDVLLRKLDNGIPEVEKLIPKPDGILEHGEMTGHAHRMVNGEVQVYATPNVDQTATYLEVKDEAGADLVHEEHDTIHPEPGHYEVVRQREYNAYDKAVRNVLD